MSRVLIPLSIHPSGEKYLAERGYEIISKTADDEDSLIELISGADAAIIKGTRITESVLRAGLPRLKIIARHGIGCDNVDVEAAARLGIWVTVTPNASVHAVAEHAAALMLALAKHIVPGDRCTKAGRWLKFRSDYMGTELIGSTLGLIGVGRIGTLVAKIAANGFGMRVVAFDPYVESQTVDPCITLLTSEKEVLGQSDFVSLHLPLLESTREKVNSQFLSDMKTDACLINTSRGEVVCEQHLADALKSGKIRGAALDVFRQEPLGEDNLFRDLDNVILSPHFATITSATQRRLAMHSAVCVDEVLSGKTPSWPVNRPV